MSREIELAEEAIALGVRVISIAGGGEPLTRWESLQQFMRAAKRNPLTWGQLITNGTRITPEMAAQIVEIGWDQILVSMDGMGVTNDEVRGEGTFAKIDRGLKNLLSARRQDRSTRVGVSCVLTDRLVEHLPAFLRYLGELGCDCFYVAKLSVYSRSQEKFALRQQTLSVLPGVLDDCVAIAEQFRMRSNVADYLRVGLAAGDAVTPAPESANRAWDPLCFKPFLALNVFPSGSVGPCCHSSDEPVASILTRSLRDVWYGAEFVALRASFLHQCSASFCAYCGLNRHLENQAIRARFQVRA